MAPNLKLGLQLDLGPLRVALQSSDPQLQRALAASIEARNDIRVIPDASAAHVLLWDVRGGPVVPAQGKVPVLALVSSADEARLARARGVRSAIDRGAQGSSMIAALIAVRYGFAVSDLEDAFAGDAAVLEDEAEPLTARETEVLQLLAAGLSNREMAPLLDVTAHTIKFHVASILNKLEATSRTEAVVEGLRRALISL